VRIVRFDRPAPGPARRRWANVVPLTEGLLYYGWNIVPERLAG